MPHRTTVLARKTRAEVSTRLGKILEEREHGLITRAEYEDRLSDLEVSLSPHATLEEADLRGGGTRFLIRCCSTGEVLACLDYRHAWTPER